MSEEYLPWSHGERLYNLLPAIYRVRDSAQGEPLRALLAIIERELETVEADIDGLYDDLFIETSAEWVIAYIGDLLGVRPLHTVDSAELYSLRAYVANTIARRRRKGTAAVLEQLARDVTNWPARVIEFFQLLSTTQHLNHVRLNNFRTPDLRDSNQLELLDTPFTRVAHTGEVRRIARGRGHYNIPNVGLFQWRLQPYAVTRSTAREVEAGHYTFNPLGLDAPLFNLPRTETAITHIAAEHNVPGQLRRRPLYDELEGQRQGITNGRSADAVRRRSIYFNQQPVLRVFREGDEVPAHEILICDLSTWRHPPTEKEYRPDEGGDPVLQTISAAVDPLNGRLTFPGGQSPEQLEVSYVYGFSSDVGGGPYNREESHAASTALLEDAAEERAVDWQVGVANSADPQPDQIFNTLTEAVDEWHDQPAGTVGLIVIMDSHTYSETVSIRIPEGSQLTLLAAEWPLEEDDEGLDVRITGHFNPDDLRPHLLGNLQVTGTAAAGSSNPGTLIINGLLVEGQLQVLAGNLGRLGLGDTTLVPSSGGLIVETAEGSENNRLEISLADSIVGPITLAETVPELYILDCIAEQTDATVDLVIQAPGTAVEINTSTIIGESEMRRLDASEVIFTGPVTVERQQVGCLRFSYIPPDSFTPRRYRCQPDLALAAYALSLGMESADDLAVSDRQSIYSRLQPVFTNDDYGQPAYAQLDGTCALEICTGAEDGSEMGVFSHLKQPQRADNLRIALTEYLRFGLEAGVFYAT